MAICSVCQSENRDGARFCKVCGSALIPVEDHISPKDDPFVSDFSSEIHDDDMPAPLLDTSSNVQEETAPSVEVINAELNVAEPTQPIAPPRVSIIQAEGEDLEPIQIQEEETRPAQSSQLAQTLPDNVDPAKRSPDPETEDLDSMLQQEFEVHSAASIADPISSHVQPSVTKPTSTLSPGTMVLNRYQIVDVLEPSDGANVYRAEDRGICHSCQVEIDPADGEKYCFNCGANLDDSSLPWATVILRERNGEVDDGTGDGTRIDEPNFEVAVDLTKQSSHQQDTPVTGFARGVNLLVGQRSDVGILRAGRPDEDSLLAVTLTGIYESNASPTVGAYIVADGMGGHGSGEVASRMATDLIGSTLLQSAITRIFQGTQTDQSTIVAILDGAIQTANRAIFELNHSSGSDMGTTVTLALVVNDTAYVANVGDSRTYLWAQDGLKRITDDHSAVFNLVKAHAIEEDEIYNHPRRSEIFRSLGAQPRVEVDHFQVPLMPGNMLVLCCDGLWEMLRTEGIADVLMLGLNEPQVICDELIRRANAAGGEDNISVIVVRVTS